METILTNSNFEKEVIDSKIPVLIDFWATWCGPCQMIAPIIEEISSERNDIKVCKVNVDEVPQLAEKFGIQYIPTLVVIKDGKETNRKSGYMKKEEIIGLI